MLLALITALLTACGRSDTLAPPAQQETATSTPVITTTLATVDETATLVAAIATYDALYPRAPADLTAIAAPERQTASALKQTEVQLDIEGRATAMARPTLIQTATPRTYIAFTPEPTLAGIYADRCAGEGWIEMEGEIFGVGNCWYGTLSDAAIKIDAGGLYAGNTTGLRGGIAVFSQTLSLATPEPSLADEMPPVDENLYWTPVEAGWPQVVSVSNEHVTLETPTGTRFYFNLLTRVWEDINGTPLPTPTASPPTPTPMP